MNQPFRVAGINFDHMHMGDLLRMVHDHPGAEIVGIAHPEPEAMEQVIGTLGIPRARAYASPEACMEEVKPDLVILCPSTGGHADWTERIAPYGANILMEKPFAASLADADRMIRAVEKSGARLAINWPLRWYPSHITAKRLVDEGVIGRLKEVHYYDGNRGPLHHLADKIEVPEELIGEKGKSWWYQKERGGGSLLDYLGYGVTLGTWFFDGASPLEVTSTVDQTPGLEVDEHSITVCRYPFGLSKFETRWGTFTDPWTFQPQPKCGFVLMGTEGTISSYDYEGTVRVQTREKPEGFDQPVDEVAAPHRNPIEHVIHCLRTGEPFTPPLDPATCRIGQQIVDSALLSSREKKTVSLLS